jgi:hypothetical protein
VSFPPPQILTSPILTSTQSSTHQRIAFLYSCAVDYAVPELSWSG